MKKYLDLRKKNNYNKIKKIALMARDGGIVVFPTETVYGIGTNALNEEAVKKIYDIKKRPLSKPISLLVSDIDMIEKVTKDITDLEYALIENFFPGPLTIILNKTDIVPEIVTAGANTVGIRMPANEIALKLIEYAGVPIATPSANISGEPSGTELNNIMKEFGESVDYYIDGGKSKIGLASTIVQVIEGVPNILREGYISKEQIEKFCEKYKN